MSNVSVAEDDPQRFAHLASVHNLPPLRSYLGDLIERRDFVLRSPAGELRAQNVLAIFGSFWLLLTPALQISVYYLVFGLLLGVDRGVDNFIGFLTVGYLTYSLTARTLPGASRLMDQNRALIRSVHFPRALIPLASGVKNVYAFLPSFVIMLVFVVLSGEPVRVQWLLAIPAFVIAVTFMQGLMFVVARLGSYFPDFSLALPHVMRLLFYGSGVLYLPSRWTTNPTILGFFDANPFFEIISLFRHALLVGHETPLRMWIAASLWAIGSLAFGFVFFWLAEVRYGR